MSRKLYILGTGGFAKEVAQLATIINATTARWEAINYLCERQESIGTPMPFGNVIGTDALLQRLNTEADYAIGIGYPQIRQRIAERLQNFSNLFAPNLIHPMADLDAAVVRLGVGNIVTSGVVFTCDIVVGDHNVFNWNSTVGHDVRIGSYCVINPGCNVSGGVSLGDGCLLGTGCQILQGLQLCGASTVGAGAVITKSVTEPGVYVGVPAKPMVQ